MLASSARKDIPSPLCAICGDAKLVTYREVYVPMRQGGAIQLTLPFNDLAYKRWHAARLLYWIAVGAGGVFFIAACGVAIWSSGVLAVLVYLGGCALPLWTHLAILRGSGPEIETAQQGALILWLPDAKAAQAFQAAVNQAEALLIHAQLQPDPYSQLNEK
ncbi:MAG: hypothetical protein M5U26_02895 [Planctomycetota bacterium]|nr:hypothetical protein [Planctomycetota bacterium]